MITKINIVSSSRVHYPKAGLIIFTSFLYFPMKLLSTPSKNQSLNWALLVSLIQNSIMNICGHVHVHKHSFYVRGTDTSKYKFQSTDNVYEQIKDNDLQWYTTYLPSFFSQLTIEPTSIVGDNAGSATFVCGGKSGL
jgi:hypothetical protein